MTITHEPSRATSGPPPGITALLVEIEDVFDDYYGALGPQAQADALDWLCATWTSPPPGTARSAFTAYPAEVPEAVRGGLDIIDRRVDDYLGALPSELDRVDALCWVSRWAQNRRPTETGRRHPRPLASGPKATPSASAAAL